MLLTDYVRAYADRRDVSQGHVDQLRWAASGLDRFAKRRISVGQLTPELLNAYLRWMRSTGRSDSYRKSRRTNLLVLWRAAADDGLAAEPPRRRIAAVRVCDRLPQAWSLEQVRRLLRAAGALSGDLPCGVSRRAYWRSWIMAAWDTGLRGCDLRSLEREWIPASGRLTIVQTKTGRRKRLNMRPTTINAIEAAFPPERRLIWPRWGCIESWRAEARSVVKAAGLPGSIGRLRHSSGTAFERARPGRGHEHLGNGRAVFERYYLDPSHLDDDRPLPPAIE